MKRLTLLSLLLLASAGAAQETTSAPTDPLALEKTLRYQTGHVDLVGGEVAVETGQALRFLGPDDARTVLVDLWGNPEAAAEGVLGMIFPANLGPLDEAGWGIVVEHERDGHVSDHDANSIDYDELLRNMQQAASESNAEREQAGVPSVNLVGWADTPKYDAVTHKLYWAKELAFSGEDDHTLNYAVRVLGRDGVLQLNAVANMKQLPQVRQDMQSVLQNVSFTPGHTYADYQEGRDKLAAYGIAALVAGGAAAKVAKGGLLVGLLLALKKFWVILLVGIGGLLSRFAGRRQA